MKLRKFEKLKKIKDASFDLTDVYRCSECNTLVTLKDSSCLICKRDFSDEIIVEEPVVEKANDKNDNDTFLIIKCPQCSGHLNDLAIVNRFCPNCKYAMTDSEINSIKPICPSCEKMQDKIKAMHCKYCGENLYPKEKINVCPECNNKYDITYKYCDIDGKELVGEELESEPEKILIPKIDSDGYSDWYEQSKEIFQKPVIKPEGNIKTSTVEKPLPMNWYYFITYVGFPLGLLQNIYFAYILDSIFVVTVGILYAAIMIFLLHRKIKWGWQFYLGSILLVIILRVIDMIAINPIVFFIVVPILCFILLYPQYLYFKKRKHLFVN